MALDFKANPVPNSSFILGFLASFGAYILKIAVKVI